MHHNALDLAQQHQYRNIIELIQEHILSAEAKVRVSSLWIDGTNVTRYLMKSV